jgi:hypothetical protein
MAMAWIGQEQSETPRVAGPGADRADWLLRVRIDGRVVEARVLDTSERDAHRYARRLAGDYTLSRL